MDILKKHARFLIVLVVVVVLLFFTSGELASSRESVERSRRAADTLLRQNYAALFRDAAAFNGDPAVVEDRRIQDRTQLLQQVEKGRLAMMAFETDRAFTVDALTAGADAADRVSYFRTKMEELRRELAYKRFFLPKVSDAGAFGFREEANIPSAQVPDLLRKLDIVRTVAGSVERAGVPRLVRLAFRAGSTDFTRRGLPVAPSAPGEEPMLSGEMLEIEVQAAESELYNLLIELQRPMKGDSRTRYLSVEKFVFEKPDLLEPTDNLVRGVITVVAWRVNEASSYPMDTNLPEQQQSSSSRPRSFR